MLYRIYKSREVRKNKKAPTDLSSNQGQWGHHGTRGNKAQGFLYHGGGRVSQSEKPPFRTEEWMFLSRLFTYNIHTFQKEFEDIF